MTQTSSTETDRVKAFLARVRSALGWATGDRRAQAKGELEELQAAGSSPPNQSSGDESQVLDDAERDVRGDHGDLAPSAEAKTTRPPSQPPQGG